MKPAFTLIEILTATMIMSIMMVVSMKSIHYMNHIHQQNEIRYLALNRLDSEMSRLVMIYVQKEQADFENTGTATTGDWNEPFDVNTDLTDDSYMIYQQNPISSSNNEFGLLVSNTPNRNLVQIKNINGDNNLVDNGDFVALLGWKVNNHLTDSTVSINLSITYPYIFDGTDIKELWDYTETLNLKTSTSILQ